MTYDGVGLNYTYSKILNALKSKGRCKSILLLSYLNKIDEDKHLSPLCPLCKSEPHTTTHLFNYTNINTHLKVTDLWKAPVEVGYLLVEWRGPPVDQRARMPTRWVIPSAGVRRNGRTPPPFFGGGVGPTTTTGSFWCIIMSLLRGPT